MQLLVVKNYGPTIARNVKVTFDPVIPDDPEAKILSFRTARYAKPIPTLTPGMELDGVWYMLTLNGAQLVPAEPTPDPCTVTITYESSDGTPYTDTFVLDVSIIANRTWSEKHHPSGSPGAAPCGCCAAVISRLLSPRLDMCW